MILRTSLLIALLVAPVFVYSPQSSDAEDVPPVETPAIRVVEVKPVEPTFQSGSLVFVGDIMLGRRVETMAQERGFVFPFASTTELITTADIAIGNLEGTVPETHIHTPDLTYRFSFQEPALVALHAAGFDVLSLANNHSYDYGLAGHAHTVRACSRAALRCAGYPNRVSTSSVERLTVGESEVALFMINATFGYPDQAELEGHLRQANETADLQIAYVHWGEEYALKHNPRQETFAQFLIDGGVDAVIGHHPHVVQDIALYKGKPIFYSLGNFVFDQYFSDEVQIGLAVQMQIDAEAVSYELIPLSTLDSRSQPRVASGDVATHLWERIMSDVAESPFVQTDSRTIVTPRFPGR